jgi:hypothetical protein
MNKIPASEKKKQVVTSHKERTEVSGCKSRIKLFLNPFSKGLERKAWPPRKTSQREPKDSSLDFLRGHELISNEILAFTPYETILLFSTLALKCLT